MRWIAPGRFDLAVIWSEMVDAILHDRPIDVFGHGKMQRDFTYVDDIVSGIVASIDKNYDEEVFNLGCGRTSSGAPSCTRRHSGVRVPPAAETMSWRPRSSGVAGRPCSAR